jgi:predicted component of type VI protein secretion system
MPAFTPAPPGYEPPHGQPAYQQPYVEPARRRAMRAHLVVDGTPRTVELKPGSNVIGRGTESDLQLLDQGVSRRHLDIYVSDAESVAYDMGSTNGTTINGHPAQSQRLQHGDVIRVGHTRLVYQQDDS